MVGRRLQVVVTLGAGTNYLGKWADDITDATNNESATTSVAYQPNSVAITGTAEIGQTLTANVTTSSDGAKSYQWWYATSESATSGTNISGATSSTYTVGTGMAGKYIGVTVNIAAGTNSNALTLSTGVTGLDTAYMVGEEVTIGTEKFYVIEDSYPSQNTVTLLAKYNLDKNPNSTTGKYYQKANGDESSTSCAFAPTNYWASDWVKGTKMDLNTYTTDAVAAAASPAQTKANNVIMRARDYATNTIGSGATGRLLTYEEAYELKNNNYKNMLYGKANKQGANSEERYLLYWLSTTDSSYNYDVFEVHGDSEAISSLWDYSWSHSLGVRPVVTVNKSLIDSKRICLAGPVEKATPKLTFSSSGGYLNIDATTTFTVKSNVAGSIVVTSEDTNSVIVTGGSKASLTPNTDHTITIKGVGKETLIHVTVSFTPTDTANYYPTSRNYSVYSVR